MNDGGDKLKSRWGVFYGDCFTHVCRLAGLSNASIATELNVSAATLSKLRKRYMGHPVERTTAERILGYLQRKIDPEVQARIKEKGYDVAGCLLPATFRLTEEARLVLAAMLPVRPPRHLREDRFYEQSVRQLKDGAFAIERHVLAVARLIHDHTQSINRPIRGVTAASDLVHQEQVDEQCYPSCYRISNAGYQRQLVLVQGGRL